METPSVRTSEEVIAAIVDRVAARSVAPDDTLQTAGLCLIDALGCAMGALATGEPQYLLGPYAPGTMTPRGARVPGTSFVLDPVKAAFDTSVLIRWLDISDTSPVGGHPSDNIGSILAVADHMSRARGPGENPLTMEDVLLAMVDAYEVHCSLAAANRFDMPAIGLDHVIYVKLASAAVGCRLMGGSADQIRAAVSQSFLDGADLNAYRHVPNAGPRKGWAGGNAASRGVILAWMAMRGEPSAPQPLSAKTWGFNQVMLDDGAVKLERELGTFFMDNVIFKLVPAQRNASTAIEAAIRLHPWFMEHRDKISKIHIATHDETMRRVVKEGPLPNREARDHCLQYMVAVALTKGRLAVEDYSDEAAADPEIDRLRGLMVVEEDERYTADHHDLAKRSCANAIEITTEDGETSERVEVLYPVGDAARRDEALPQLREKFIGMTGHAWTTDRQERVLGLLSDLPRLRETPVPEFMTLVSESDVL
ncbi:2-methylcitrate dehydratase [Agaricicola taiwanensis]|uniref:2-methylcitrate dehydratase n=1 Tax=Agaricicola taiwanensis TaxID=591372 RepID=A0A8J2YLV9_9RHOB|nr:2-methylcitrate dehydratase [Agaricicola taiwanensis]GGE52652.1 2-methylcitrate dehydratase [Agaricicola taiwanensis]